jgi:hypothetical protein
LARKWFRSWEGYGTALPDAGEPTFRIDGRHRFEKQEGEIFERLCPQDAMQTF